MVGGNQGTLVVHVPAIWSKFFSRNSYQLEGYIVASGITSHLH